MPGDADQHFTQRAKPGGDAACQFGTPPHGAGSCEGRSARPPWQLFLLGDPAMTLASRRQVLTGLGLAATTVLLAPALRAQGTPAGTPAGTSAGAPAGAPAEVLTARPGMLRLMGAEAPETAVLGYDGSVPGPVLRARRGVPFAVTFRNETTTGQTIHWHGVRLPNAMDGVPGLTQPPVKPGTSFEYRFTPQDAGTYWYHPHDAEALDRGLYGLFIVDEPDTYPVDREIALVFDDWRLDDKGQIRADFDDPHEAAHAGRMGEVPTLNSARETLLEGRPFERLRLRLVSVANARIVALEIGGEAGVTLIALDGQPSEVFRLAGGRIVLAPGNRADVVVDLPAAGEVPLKLLSADGEAQLGRIAVTGEPLRAAPAGQPPALPANPLPVRIPFQGAFRRDVVIAGGAATGVPRPAGPAPGRSPGPQAGHHGGHHGGHGGHHGGHGGHGGHGHAASGAQWTLGGRASTGHDGPALFSVRRGRTVMLAFVNDTGFPHAMHLHGHHFRVLDRLDDGWKPWWLDTVLVMPWQTERIAFIADNPGKWVIHCHMLEHHATGMGAWFEVT
jgi:FtsP/CotA-like multicopper oxidase with cupredoxin domain